MVHNVHERVLTSRPRWSAGCSTASAGRRRAVALTRRGRRCGWTARPRSARRAGTARSATGSPTYRPQRLGRRSRWSRARASHGSHTFGRWHAGRPAPVLRHGSSRGLTGADAAAVAAGRAAGCTTRVLEDLLDRAEAALGTGPARPARWSPWVRLLRRSGAPAGPGDRGAGHPAAGRRAAAGGLRRRVRRPGASRARPPTRRSGRTRSSGTRRAGSVGLLVLREAVVGSGRDRARRAVLVRHPRPHRRGGAARHRRAPPRLPGVRAREPRAGGADHRRAAAQPARPRVLRAGPPGAPGDRARRC